MKDFGTCGGLFWGTNTSGKLQGYALCRRPLDAGGEWDAPREAPGQAAETAGPWRTDRACGPRPPVPNVAFWTDKKTSSLSCLPAAKAHKRRLRHTETAGPWRTDRACGLRPPVPNVAFWTDKKTSSLSCLSSSREGSPTAPSPHRNSRALKDGPGLRATAPSA